MKYRRSLANQTKDSVITRSGSIHIYTLPQMVRSVRTSYFIYTRVTKVTKL